MLRIDDASKPASFLRPNSDNLFEAIDNDSKEASRIAIFII